MRKLRRLFDVEEIGGRKWRKDKLGWFEEIYEDREWRSRVNISGRRFVFDMNKDKYFVEIAGSVMIPGFGLSRYLEGFMRVGRGMMIFVFEMNKYRKFMKIAESVMIFGFGMSRDLGGFMRVGRGVMIFGFGMSRNLEGFMRVGRGVMRFGLEMNECG